ncbi:MAG TPA: hypothetical protein VGL82_21590 [Bryobacteraceae bacterium]
MTAKRRLCCGDAWPIEERTGWTVRCARQEYERVEFQHWQVIFNPVFERAIRGRVFSPSIEYYGEIESISARPHAQPETHQMFLGGDWEVKPQFTINLGLGFDLGDRGPE